MVLLGRGFKKRYFYPHFLDKGCTPPLSTLSTSADFMILDGVGPVDNRPSTDLLHHFIHFLNFLI